MFELENGREQFYQWDTNQRLIVNDDSITEVHFSNRTEPCSLVCEVVEETDKRYVNVPNILLQNIWDIHVYAYCKCYTKVEKRYKVIPRSKPANYVYTETEVKRWEDEVAERKAADEAIRKDLETAIASVDLSDYAKKVDIPSLDGYTKTEELPVKDVQINGTSIVAGGVANVKLYANSFGMNASGIYLRNANNDQITARSSNTAVTPQNLDYAVKATMCDGKGAAWTADEQAAARARIGIYKVTQAEYDALTNTSGIYIIVEE